MKRMLPLLLIVLSFPVLCMGESAIQSEGNMSYIITSEGAVIIDWNNQLPDVLDATLYVPPTLGGIPVVGIGFDAFDTCNEGPSTQFQLILPEGITFLEKELFSVATKPRSFRCRQHWRRSQRGALFMLKLKSYFLMGTLISQLKMVF